MAITRQQLAASIGCPFSRAELWTDPLNAAMDKYGINTPLRQAAFLAQVGHESGRLVYVKEMWGPTPSQCRYEYRADLGNSQPGDGLKYRGRGLIQITGRANYKKVSEALGMDFVTSPAMLEWPEYAADSAAWFWQSHGCNELADAGNFEAITRRINGGLNGQSDRLALWDMAKDSLEVKSA